MTIGQVIERYFRDHGMSYRQFSEKSSLTSGYISMLVNNRNPKTGEPPAPSVKTYRKIADAMGVPLNEILQETEKDTPTYFHTVTKAPSPEGPSKYDGLAKAIVDKLIESDGLSAFDDDDEIIQMREEMRRNPELRTMLSLTRGATKKQMKQIETFTKRSCPVKGWRKVAGTIRRYFPNKSEWEPVSTNSRTRMFSSSRYTSSQSGSRCNSRCPR